MILTVKFNALVALTFLTWLLASADTAQGCVAAHRPTATMIDDAEVIVRATATAKVEGGIEFRIEEVLRGAAPEKLTIKGYFLDEDDFNPRPVPYPMVRSSGSGGPCHAYSYKEGAQYLLFLQSSDAGLSPYWSALAPVNEQLRSADDEWLRWVKEYLQGQGEYGSNGKTGRRLLFGDGMGTPPLPQRHNLTGA